jgi:hypothetical protein
VIRASAGRSYQGAQYLGPGIGPTHRRTSVYERRLVVALLQTARAVGLDRVPCSPLGLMFLLSRRPPARGAYALDTTDSLAGLKAIDVNPPRNHACVEVYVRGPRERRQSPRYERAA